jgi:CDP-glucose 4,6-dehydratase
MDSRLDIYKNKKVFVTGHTGFKGSWLITLLHLLGAKVKGYALEQEVESLYNSIKGNELVESIIGDIRNANFLKQELVSFEPDFIFHLAAQPLVRASYEDPIGTFDINVSGTSNLLNAVRFLGKPCQVVIITTDKVYQNKEWLYPYRENDRLGGYDPYSASKACTELVVDSYRNSFFNPIHLESHKTKIVTVRAGNVIGGGDFSKDRIVPDIIRALSSNNTIQVRNPLSIRPWQHVIEPLVGYLLTGAALCENHEHEYETAYNFGPFDNDELTVAELVNIAVKCWGSGVFSSPLLKDQPHEAGILKLDINKAINLLGWKPKWNANEAIFQTIEWYKKAPISDPRELVINQLNYYFQS